MDSNLKSPPTATACRRLAVVLGDQVRNLDRSPAEELVQIRQQSAQIRGMTTAKTSGEA